MFQLTDFADLLGLRWSNFYARRGDGRLLFSNLGHFKDGHFGLVINTQEQTRRVAVGDASYLQVSPR